MTTLILPHPLRLMHNELDRASPQWRTIRLYRGVNMPGPLQDVFYEAEDRVYYSVAAYPSVFVLDTSLIPYKFFQDF